MLTAENFAVTKAYNYLHSNKIGKVLLKKHSKFIFLKAAVAPSQSVNQAKHTSWVMLKESGVAETGGCSCIVGLGKSCNVSHAATILWKIFINPHNYFSVKATSHANFCSSFLSMACRSQVTDMFVEDVDVLHKTFLKKPSIFMNCCGNQQRHMLYLSSF